MSQKRQPLIAHVIFRLATGGLENGLVNLINGLPQDSFDHAIICIDRFTDFRQRITRDNVRIIAIHKRPGTDLAAMLRLFRVFRDLEPAIVHTRNLAALDALLPAFVAGVPYRIHSEHGWDVADLDGSSRKHRLLRRLHAPLVHRYIALSQHLERYLVNGVGIAGKRITQIYNGVDTGRFRPRQAATSSRRSAARDRFGDNAVLIGSVGRMQGVKDPLNLVRAFELLIERNPDLADEVRLVMIGDGSLREAALAQLHEAGIADHAWLPGQRDDIAELLPSCDIYVQPSLAEGVSNTILEAMACGLPVVATDVGGNAELVVADQTGVIVPAADAAAIAKALEPYIRRPDLRRRHGDAARTRTEESFGIDVMMERYLAIYRQLAGQA